MSLRDPDPRQTVQRVRVGLVGLAAVILLIGLAGMIFSALRREQPSTVPGATNAAAALDGNAAEANDPLADLGVAPGAPAPALSNTR